MAPIKNPITPEIIKAPSKYAEEILKAVNASNLLTESLIKLNETASKTSTSDETATKKKQQLTAVEKEANRISKETEKVEAKLSLARSKKVKELTAEKLKLQETNKEVKNNIIESKRAQLTNEALKGSINAIKASLAANLIAVGKLTRAEREHSKEGKKLTATIKAQRAELSKVETAQGNATRGVGKYAEGITTAATSLIGAFGLVGGIAAFAKILTSATKTVIQSSKAQSVLASVLGKTKKEITELTKDSLEYGKTTQFTAVQVAQLQTELAKLGFKEDEIRNSTRAILDFALATDAQLAPAAKVAGSVLRALGLEATEMLRVTSVLAVATTKTALSFEDYEGNLSKVLPVAKAFGFGLEDTVALFGKLRDAGFDATTAATATRNIFLNMADANGELAKALGGNVENFDDLISGLVRMNEEGFDLNETLKLTDRRSVAAFNQFLIGAESAKILKDDITDVNDALGVMVETRTDNAASAIIKLGSAWDGLILKFRNSEGFIKDFLDVTTDTLGQIDRLLSSDSENLSKDIDGFLAGTSQAAKETIDFWKENSEGVDDYLKNIEKAIDSQSKFTTELFVESKKDGGDDSRKQFDKQRAILINLQKELVSAQNDIIAKGLAEKFDIENKSIEDLKRLQKAFISFETGEMKAQGDLILPLIENQIKEREKLEFEANQKRAREARKSAKEIAKIAKNESDIDIQIAEDTEDERIKLNNETDLFLAKLREDNIKSVDDSAQKIVDSEKKAAEERKKIANKLADDKLALERMVKDATIDLTAQGAQAITDLLLEASSQRRDEELERLDEQRDEDLERVDEQTNEDLANEDAKVEAEIQTEEQAAENKKRITEASEAEKTRIEAEADRKAAAIKTQQARAEKAAAIAQIAVDTAVGIIKYLSNPLTAPLVPFLIGSAAVQTAAVLATPIPKFFKGTKSAPSGTISVSEKGSELIIPKTGDPFMSPDTQTFYSDLQGAEIVPNHQVKERLAEMGSKGGSSFSDVRLLNKLDTIAKNTKKNSRSNTVDSVTTTRTGDRRRNDHKSFLSGMKR